MEVVAVNSRVKYSNLYQRSADRRTKNHPLPHQFSSRLRASGDSLKGIFDSYLIFVDLVDPTDARGQAPDPDDDVVIGTAIAARADLLVTGDRALLGVGTYEGGRIVSVSGALKILESTGGLDSA